MAGFDIDLAGLNLADDLEVGAFGVEDPNTYQDPTAVAPPREGRYLLRITEFNQAKEFGSDKPLIVDGKWPVFEIREIEIVEPTEIARKVRLNQKVRTKPFSRAGANGESLVSEFADLLRAYDVSRAWKGLTGDGDGSLPTGLQLLKEFMETGATLRGRGQWRAYDKTYADAAIAAAGGENNVSKEEMGRINGKASIRGMKKFPTTSKGGYIPEVKGPSGDIIRAKFIIAQFFPSNDKKVKIGLD